MNIHEIYQKVIGANYQISIDTRTLQKGDVFFALTGDNFDGHEYIQQALNAGASSIIIDNEIYSSDKYTILVSNVLEVFQDLAHYHRMQFDIPVIGLTGSNGKTTTKELMALVLGSMKSVVATQGNFNNHIGVPLTLFRIRLNTEIAIIEMGANHVGEIKILCEIAAPNFGIITNIGRAHIGLFGGFENIIRGKTELYRYIEAHQGQLFVHSDNQILLNNKGNTQKRTYSTVDTEANTLVTIKKHSPFVSVGWKGVSVQSNLTGIYNIDNIAAAIAVGEYFMISDKNIKTAIESYIPTNERSEIVKTKKGNTIIKDYYNANTSSMLLALENLAEIETTQKKIAILGDMFEMGKYSQQDHTDVLEKALSCEFDDIYLAGKDFLEVSMGYISVTVFDSTDGLLSELKNRDFEDSLVLIKASQGMKFKKIFEDVDW